MTRSALFGPMLTTPAMAEAVSDRAWLQAMLDAEAALARACARAGLIQAEAATAIGARCAADLFSAEALGLAAKEAANPVVPLVEALRALVPGEHARWVHHGATSQDILDTAAMLVTRNALEILLGNLTRAGHACVARAEAHRETMMIGRTLLQQAVPTTFALKAAGWLGALIEARDNLKRVRETRLAAQLGGAAGTLAAYGEHAEAVSVAFAEEVGLLHAALPWHTNRVRVAEIGAALAIAAGVTEKIALDVLLMAQTEVGEVAEAAAPGRGRSSAMAHKRNPVGSVAVIASAKHARAAAGILFEAMAQEHERAAGAWQAEWVALADGLAATDGAVGSIAAVLEGLEVHADRMRSNTMTMDTTGVSVATRWLVDAAMATWRERLIAGRD